jgi:hypothetical protein
MASMSLTDSGSIFHFQMVALGVFSSGAILVQVALMRFGGAGADLGWNEITVDFRNRTFQFAGLLFCLLNLAVAVFQYHFAPAPANSGSMAFKMLFNAGVMGALAIAGQRISTYITFRSKQVACALLAVAIHSAGLVFFDLFFAGLWFWHFIQGV